MSGNTRKGKILKQLDSTLGRRPEVRTAVEYNDLHQSFCDWFTSEIWTTGRVRNGTVIKHAGPATYGHAAKVLDVTSKVYVYYSRLPDNETANRIVHFLKTGIDGPILKHLRETYADEKISAVNVADIDQSLYQRLQGLILTDISNQFEGAILLCQYDDIMWDRFNR